MIASVIQLDQTVARVASLPSVLGCEAKELLDGRVMGTIALV